MAKQFIDKVVLFLMVSACLFQVGCDPDSTGSTRPNIIIIMSDDMGFSDIGCYGGEINTPNLDRLAEEGIRFTRFYSTAKCMSSRGCLLTGLHEGKMARLAHLNNPRSNL